MDERDWQGRAARLFCYCAYAAALFFIVKYLLYVIAPILIAFCLSAVVYCAAGKISERTHIPRGICSAVLLTLIFAAVGFGAFYACRQLLSEIRALLGRPMEDSFSIIGHFLDKLEGVGLTATIADATEKYASAELAPLALRLLTSLADSVTTLLSRVVRSTPSAIVNGVLMMVACYYLCIDFDRICDFLRELLPQVAMQRINRIKSGAMSVAVGYLKGYSILLLLTFAEALVGLLILCPAYAWLWALVIAFVDLLPVLGIGTVLIPWGVVSIVCGNYFLGIGLIALYIVMTVVRQIVEPYVLGKGLGLHPLASLLAMFIGFRLLGAGGMLLLPLLLAIVVRAREK